MSIVTRSGARYQTCPRSDSGTVGPNSWNPKGVGVAFFKSTLPDPAAVAGFLPGERRAAVKFCGSCERELGLAQFAVDRSRPSGRKSLCKRCDREKARRYYEANRERVLARVKAGQRAG